MPYRIKQSAIALFISWGRRVDWPTAASSREPMASSPRPTRCCRASAKRPRRGAIAELATPEGQFAIQFDRACTAVGNDDYAEAEKVLAEAERLKPEAPQIAELRQAMQAAQQKEARRSSQVTELLAAMREAIARKDVAGADRAFNEAARIDVLDPALDEARVELAHAHEAARGKN